MMADAPLAGGPPRSIITPDAEWIPSESLRRAGDALMSFFIGIAGPWLVVSALLLMWHRREQERPVRVTSTESGGYPPRA
ncbi:hypothetical protein IHEIED_02585 [Methylorubrum populi]